MKKNLLLFAFLFLQFSAAGQSLRTETNRGSFRLPEVAGGYGTYHALIIAVQKYDSDGWSDPGFTIDSARRLKQVLTEKYMFNSANITFLQDPTRLEIIEEFDRMRQTLTVSDNLLIFYVGLGNWMDDVSEGYWIPRDAVFERRKTWISNATVADYVRRVEARHVLLISDARIKGHDSLVVKDPSSADSAFVRMSQRRSRRAITGNGMQENFINRDFVDRVILALDRNQKVRISAEQLFDDIHGVVRDLTGKEPVYGVIRDATDEGGDFIFVRRQ